MRIQRNILLLTILFLISSSQVSAGIREGIEANKRGDYREAVRHFRPLAEAGDPKAQHLLGMMYHSGYGVPKKHCEALKWFQRAADQDHLDSQAMIGTMYYNGECVKRNYINAAKFYRLAAERGDTKCQAALGTMYREGKGVKQNYKEAVKWLSFAAQQGNPIAMINLAARYHTATGVSRDYLKAYMWYDLASKAARGKIKKIAIHGIMRISRELKSEQIYHAKIMSDNWSPKTWEELKVLLK